MKKLLVITLFLVCCTGCVSNTFEDDYNDLVDDYNALVKENNELKSIVKEEKEMNCGFTKTFSLLQKLNYEDNIEENGFVILSEFQSYGPAIARLDKSYIDQMEVGKSYEFRFVGKVDYEVTDHLSIIFDTFEVESMKETSKTGLGQIIEPITCK